MVELRETKNPVKTILAQIFLGLAIASLSAHAGKIPNIWQLSTFCLFFILFRVKMYWDDILSYKKTDNNSIIFIFSYFFGMFSWFIWLLSPSYLPFFEKSLRAILYAFILMTLSCFLSLKFSDKNNLWQHIKYITFNSGYGIVIVCNLYEMLSYYVSISIMIVLCIIDMVVNKSYTAIYKESF